jgi:Tfp pilus assembly protein PilZ
MATAMAGTPVAVAASPAAPAANAAHGQAAAEAEALARQVAEAEARAAEIRNLAEQKAAEAARQAEAARLQAEQEAAKQAKEFMRVPGQTDAPEPPNGALRLEVELGAHSSSNFYKGLSGNDVVDHGGIFVATYQIPKVGTPVALRVLLPGDLEFDADAIVQWVRETRSGDSAPGFGARLTRISGEGRQLVYRYARNREPMFHDDF